MPGNLSSNPPSNPPSNLRRLLPRTFGAFLARFPAATEVQRQAIPAILRGADTLLSAPTASGKTEAFAAPTAELLLAAHAAQPQALFVSPTRALANDLKRRLEGRFADVDLTFGRYTGEHKERVVGQLPAVTVTTPEALDALLARRPNVLRRVRLIVLDEVHVLDGTPRGDQVRILLHRLEQVTELRPQRIVASATLPDPAATAERYLRQPTLVTAGGGRKITGKLFVGRTSQALAIHLEELAAHGFRKVLVFCNRRADVEDHASWLRGRTRFGAAVFAHHGSLGQAERERAERQFLTAEAAVAIATMTLELGIDIGSIDYVLLAGPPPSVMNLMQRIGRGNRRTSRTRCGYAVESPTEELLCRTLLAAAAQGDLLASGYAFRPSVIVQQAIVIAGARGWIDAEVLERALPRWAHEALVPATVPDLLAAMVDTKLLEASGGGRFVLREAIDQRYQIGVCHSNLADEATLDVVDRLTGDIVGHVATTLSPRLRLAGRGRTIVAQSAGRILSDPGRHAERAQFVARGIPTVSLALARRVVQTLDVEADAIHQVLHAGSVVLLHGLGTLGALFLASLLRETGTVQRMTPYVAHLARPLQALPTPTHALVVRHVQELEAKLAQLCAMGPWHRHLPQAVRERAVAQASGLDAVARVLGACRLVTMETATVTQARYLGSL